MATGEVATCEGAWRCFRDALSKGSSGAGRRVQGGLALCKPPVCPMACPTGPESPATPPSWGLCSASQGLPRTLGPENTHQCQLWDLGSLRYPGEPEIPCGNYLPELWDPCSLQPWIVGSTPQSSSLSSLPGPMGGSRVDASFSVAVVSAEALSGQGPRVRVGSEELSWWLQPQRPISRGSSGCWPEVCT